MRKQRIKDMLPFVKLMHDNGIRVVTGTDGGAEASQTTPIGHSTHREVQLFVEAGVPPLAAIRDATLDARDYLQKHRRIPARVFIGADTVPPADFLTGLAFTLHYYYEKHALPLGQNIPLANVEVTPMRYVAQDSAELFGGWVIHREGFRAPNILAVARLQAWTLKPALRAKSQ